MKIRIAELNVEIHHRYPYIKRLCQAYWTDFERADISVTVTPEEIEAEQKAAPGGTSPSLGYAEAICAYRAIALLLPRFDAFLFHSAVVECDGLAYAFSAPSGTGKSTHAALWLRTFGKRARILNGDKPIFRFIDGQLLAFGTPWCGKEKQGVNAVAPLAAICFLERGKENSIRPLDNAAAVERLFGQILMPTEPKEALLFLDLLDRTLQTTPFYLLACNTDPEAALIAHRGMQKGEEHDSQQ